jgi:hypothetical protein
LRRTRQILAEDLANIEDLYVRHSDSMLEYPTFGEILAPLPYGVFAQRVEHEMKGDDRVGALAYYLAYLAENAFYYHKNETGAQFAAKALARIRTPGDLGLKLHLLMLKLAQARSDMEGATYQALTQEIFKLNRSELRNLVFHYP